MRIQRALLCALATTALTAAACGGSDDGDSAAENGAATTAAGAATEGGGGATTYPFTFENCGRSITLAKAPEKILTLGTSAVTMLHVAGATDKVVARAGEFGTPTPGEAGEAVADVPVLAEDDPGTEAVVGSGADTVIGYGLFNTTEEDLANSGVTSITLSSACGSDDGENGETFEAMYRDIELYGKLFGSSDEATAAIADLRQRIDAVPSASEDGKPLSAANVYFWGDTPSSRGGHSITTEVFNAIGLTNVFEDVEESFIENNMEDLVKRNPDVLVINYLVQGESFEDSKSRLLALPGVAAMDAVKNDRIVGVPAYEMQPDPNVIDGLERIAGELRAK